MSKEIYYSPLRIHSRAEHDSENSAKRHYVGVVSSTAPDTKHTIMDLSSLKNFARAARVGSGVPIYSAHKYDEYPIGRSTKGWVKENKEFWSEFFIRAGLVDSVTGTATDDIITRIDEGIITDLSKGFTGGQWYCSEDGEPFRGSWWKECPNGHVLGETITKKGKEIQIMALVKNARLHHFSPVGSGSNPDAKIKEQLRNQLNDRSDCEQIAETICGIHNLNFASVRDDLLQPTSFTRSFKMSTENQNETPENRNDDALNHLTIQDLQEEVSELRSENNELKEKLDLGSFDDFSEEIGELKKQLREASQELSDNRVLAEQGKIALDIARREAEESYIDYQGSKIKGENDPKLAEVRGEIDRCFSIHTLNEMRNTYRKLARQERMGGRKSFDTTKSVGVGNRHTSTPPANYGLNLTNVV